MACEIPDAHIPKRMPISLSFFRHIIDSSGAHPLLFLLFNPVTPERLALPGESVKNEDLTPVFWTPVFWTGESVISEDLTPVF